MNKIKGVDYLKKKTFIGFEIKSLAMIFIHHCKNSTDIIGVFPQTHSRLLMFPLSSSHFRVSNAITCIRWDWNAEINFNIEYNTRNHQNIAKLMIYNHNICFFTIDIFANFVWGFFQWILCALLSPFYFFLGAGNVRAFSKAGKILINVAVSIFKFCCPRLKMKKRYMFNLFTL